MHQDLAVYFSIFPLIGNMFDSEISPRQNSFFHFVKWCWWISQRKSSLVFYRSYSIPHILLFSCLPFSLICCWYVTDDVQSKGCTVMDEEEKQKALASEAASNDIDIIFQAKPLKRIGSSVGKTKDVVCWHIQLCYQDYLISI